MKIAKKNQKGFTLLEVMAAIGILTIGILSIVGMQYLIVNGNTNANVVTHELNLAKRILEEYKNSSNVSSLSGSVMNGVDESGEPGGPYNVVVDVGSAPNDSIGFARFVRVSVTKQGGIGGHEITLRCLTQGNGI